MKKLLLRATLVLPLLAPALLPAGGAQLGGKVVDGAAIQCDLPAALQKKNIASRGLGCCVFRSLDHAAHWQNVPALYDFPEWLVHEGIAGGGYPQKVDALIPRISAARQLPAPDYIQVESADLEILKLACRTGRMPCITYCQSATGRYGPGARIAHMVNLVAAGIGNGPDGKGWYVILDNNFPGEQNYEWLSESEFLRTYLCGRTGWCVILLSPPPPPVPVP